MDLIKYIRTSFRSRYKRPELSSEQLAFLQGLVPFGIIMQEQTYLKSQGRKNTRNGMYASVIMADLIVRSDWGSLEPAAKWSNLGLLKKDTIPKIKCTTKKWLGEAYREYNSWFDFAVDMTDHYIFSNLYDEILLGQNSDLQSDALIRFHSFQNITTYGSIEEIIADYGLIEFDSFYK